MAGVIEHRQIQRVISRKSSRRKRIWSSVEPAYKESYNAAKKAKVVEVEESLKKKVLCPCLFPHSNRIDELFLAFWETILEKPSLKRQKSIQDELQRKEKVLKTPRIELSYDSDDILKLVEENTDERGHRKGCLFKTDAEQDALPVVAAVILSKRNAFDETKISKMMKQRKMSNFIIIFVSQTGSTDKKIDERTYEIQESGKAIRTALTFLLEKPIRDNLKGMHLRLERKKERKLLEKYKAISSRPVLRSVTSRFAQLKGSGISKTPNKIEEFRNLYPREFLKVSDSYDYIIDRVSCLENEIIREPGNCQTIQKQRCQKKISESLKSALGKLEAVKIFGYVHDVFEIWLDENMARQKKLEFESHLLKLTKEICRFRYVKYERSVTKIKPGDKLHREEIKESFGTIGAFAESKDDVVAITISHVVNGILGPLIQSNDSWHRIGDVVKLFDSEKEHVGFIHINKSFRDWVELQIEKDDKFLDSKLFEKDDNLANENQLVYKKGAKSAWTKGIVKLDKQDPNEQGLVIENFRNGDAKFAEEGDSGSAIIKFDPEDPDNKTVDVISILSGQFTEDDRNIGYFSFRLKHPLGKLSEKRKATFILK